MYKPLYDWFYVYIMVLINYIEALGSMSKLLLRWLFTFKYLFEYNAFILKKKKKVFYTQL